MAPSRGKGRAAAASAGTPRSSGRTTRARTRKAAHDDVPDVYSAMLSEAHTDGETDEDRPLKIRRITPKKSGYQDPSAPITQSADLKKPGIPLHPTKGRPQTVEDSSESDDSEFDFEDVDIDQPMESAGHSVDSIEDLSISVQRESSTPASARARRKPLGTIEKTHRLLVHKLHILCLLGHCMFVNGRCNNVIAQGHLRSILPVKTISYLNPSQQDTQFQRNRSFMEGLEQAVSAFTGEYRITGSGLKKPHWTLEGDTQQTKAGDPVPVDSGDFIDASQSLSGSQDMANQLFCAMLRSVGVDARIVCSLQVLPFNSVPKAATPKKPAKARIMAMPPYDGPDDLNDGQNDAAVSGSRLIGKVPSARRRLGQPSFASEATRPAVPLKKPAPVVKLAYPVFWVEAFNEASQKWVPVDPIVTNTINRPTKLEPPASYDLNQLTYVVAHEADGFARDVTRRYAKAYNAKTRRQRVESSVDGTRWLKKAMRIFRRPEGLRDRDQVEDAEMAQKEAREGLPANVLDFKDHPYYALERHLKRHEVIHPKREVGKVNAGTAAKPKMESVYRRRDVLSCKSADKWYRSGREIKAGEQPLKHVPARVRRQASQEPNGGSDDHAPTTGLYAPHQTQLYVPPPIQHGRVPKNMYGNLDIYTSTMVPAGGVHIRHALTQQAARALRVDYADAVTGFQFKGRHGTAIIEGAVVAAKHADAIRAIIDGLELEALEDESKARSLRALRAWKRFLTGLRIAERVRAYGDASLPVRTHADDADNGLFASMVAPGTDEELLTAGRFSLKELERKKAPARKRKVEASDSEEDFEYSVNEQSEEEEAGGFVVERNSAEVDEHGGFLPDADEAIEDQNEMHDSSGLDTNNVTQSEYGGGGFLPEGNANGDEDEHGREGSPGKGMAEHSHDESPLEDNAGYEFAGGFLPDDNEHGNEDDVQNGDRNAPDASTDHDRTSETDLWPGATMHASGSNSTTGLVHSEKLVLGDGESDNGSMLSHDPEDDEAEPDWLESD
ncbi:Rad4-domain-containing protein [Sphaerulina musiva SO2202]|uniref:Rad4-domain-containing protein n=1 Tax=Sphaerulina musiva (strain SO2202) TaxID=692275 RepID=N1QKC8_SPHMS|nr:Rad4-domain-containing protein [Sphaerulina musiva SO2202]EMF17686.1 Rad4-domain-containing protein [Sphaerulina musiva SO2202]